ncbi:hypothetical protein P175DRAFT_0344540 [Aspergillus ochraceoroseus IBT 24754]|uniref:Uncharacterized protein n=1 Tax=Aspergillus ochraceoroseus IBT 24754 TaxID=1392256 RepID=A0A2T5LNX9_9EURO|nr:uncharacterized protein P175DRAFT_0344540 [Aspergillus ochraceoroseus IBT 24754]PTU17990.1 hypothetical protein P175DRAFT_0344540 [Aspergillus ochraceoroseus IBT 24754]
MNLEKKRERERKRELAAGRESACFKSRNDSHKSRWVVPATCIEAFGVSSTQTHLLRVFFFFFFFFFSFPVKLREAIAIGPRWYILIHEWCSANMAHGLHGQIPDWSHPAARRAASCGWYLIHPDLDLIS